MLKVVLGLLLALLTIESLFLVKSYSQKTNSKLNPVSVMNVIWLLLLNIAFYFGSTFGFYAVDFSCIVFVVLFLNIITLVAWFSSKGQLKNNHLIDERQVYTTIIDSRRMYTLTLLVFAVFLISNVFYFRDLGRHLSLTSLYTNIWAWKNLVLTGAFQENSILYIGRNLSVVGTVFALNLIINWNNKSRRFISLIICFVYVLTVFFNPRRDPMIDKLIFFLCPFLFIYRNRLSKMYKFLIPIGIAFTLLFIYISDALTFGQGSILELSGRYTFAPFNSLQCAIDNGYPPNTTLFLGNTFYFVYMMLKYITPELTPPDIVLIPLGNNTGNVYTALIAPLIDSHENLVAFFFILVLYAVYIGLVIGIWEAFLML